MKVKKVSFIPGILVLLIPLLLLCFLNPRADAALARERCEVEINCDEITRLPGTFVTNNTKITVSTDADQPAVTVYLFDTESAGPILEMELKSGATDSFTLLTGARIYQIGVKSHTLGTTRVTLEIAYLP